MRCKEKSSVVFPRAGVLERKPFAIVHTPRSFSVVLVMVVDEYDANTYSSCPGAVGQIQEHHGHINPVGAAPIRPVL